MPICVSYHRNVSKPSAHGLSMIIEHSDEKPHEWRRSPGPVHNNMTPTATCVVGTIDALLDAIGPVVDKRSFNVIWLHGPGCGYQLVMGSVTAFMAKLNRSCDGAYRCSVVGSVTPSGRFVADLEI